MAPAFPWVLNSAFSPVPSVIRLSKSSIARDSFPSRSERGRNARTDRRASPRLDLASSLARLIRSEASAALPRAVAPHPVALRRDRSFTALFRQSHQLETQHGLMRHRPRQLDFFLPDLPFLFE